MGSSPLLLADEESIVGRRAVFASKHLWVTPHSDSQRFPAGDYVMQANDCRGLALWTKEVGLRTHAAAAVDMPC
jgi:primary-amine oxidase